MVSQRIIRSESLMSSQAVTCPAFQSLPPACFLGTSALLVGVRPGTAKRSIVNECLCLVSFVDLEQLDIVNHQPLSSPLVSKIVHFNELNMSLSRGPTLSALSFCLFMSLLSLPNLSVVKPTKMMPCPEVRIKYFARVLSLPILQYQHITFGVCKIGF